MTDSFNTLKSCAQLESCKPVKRSPDDIEYKYSGEYKYEICIDEVGRGPMFGRVYTAGVILPIDKCEFNCKDVKDSKKFTSKKKIVDVANRIKTECIWNIDYQESETIDKVNILQAVLISMKNNIGHLLTQLKVHDSKLNVEKDVLIVVDGNQFGSYTYYDDEQGLIVEIPHVTVEQGDAKYTGIAAASIIAKVAHDEYIHELCSRYPLLNERYNLDKNVGYGTKEHLAGIEKYGITQWHRRSFGRCKYAPVNPL